MNKLNINSPSSPQINPSSSGETDSSQNSSKGRLGGHSFEVNFGGKNSSPGSLNSLDDELAAINTDFNAFEESGARAKKDLSEAIQQITGNIGKASNIERQGDDLRANARQNKKEISALNKKLKAQNDALSFSGITNFFGLRKKTTPPSEG